MCAYSTSNRLHRVHSPSRYRVVSQRAFPLAALVFVHAEHLQTLNFLLQRFVVDDLITGDRLLAAGTPGRGPVQTR